LVHFFVLGTIFRYHICMSRHGKHSGYKSSLSSERLIKDSYDGVEKGFLPRLTVGNCFLIVLILFVCVAVAVVHWPALSAEALAFDDGEYLTENRLVQNPSWDSASKFLGEVLEPTTVRGYYQPFTMISLMLDCALGGNNDNLMPFHRTSLILHILNTVLIIFLLFQLFGNTWLAAGAGLLFALHPMTVEPIPWVGERKTLLACFFTLWSIIFYVYFTRKGGWKLSGAVLVTYILALMSKPTSTALPLMLLVMDYWPLNRLSVKSFVEKIPLFVAGGCFAVITYISQSRTAAAAVGGGYGVGRAGLVISHNIVFYLKKIIWPANLSPFYAFPEPLGLSQPAVFAGVIGTCVLIVILIVSLRWTKAVLAGWFFFFVAIFPTMGFVRFTNVIASDKFAYLPSLGLLMMLTAGVKWLWAKVRDMQINFWRVIIICVFVLLGCVEGIASRRQLCYWRDSISLYERMLQFAPDVAIVRYNLGLACEQAQRWDEAITHYTRAAQIRPGHHKTYNNLGNAFYATDRIEEAKNCYRQSLRINPSYGPAYYNLGNLLKSEGKLDEAIDKYRRAIFLVPDYAPLYYELGLALKEKGFADEALAMFRKASALVSSREGKEMIDNIQKEIEFYK